MPLPWGFALGQSLPRGQCRGMALPTHPPMEGYHRHDPGTQPCPPAAADPDGSRLSSAPPLFPFYLPASETNHV